MAGEMTAEERACAEDAIDDNSGLADRVDDAFTFEALDAEDQIDVIVIAFDCAPETFGASLAEGFTEGAGLDLGPEVPACFVDGMSDQNPERRAVIAAFAALGQDQPSPPDAVEPAADVFVECIPGSVFTEVIMSEAASDPAMAEAVDTECLSGDLSGETLRPMWVDLLENPQADIENSEAMGGLFEVLFGCLSFGQVMNSQFGGTLTDEQIVCIDEGLVGFDLAALALGGEVDPEAEATLGTLMLDCLS